MNDFFEPTQKRRFINSIVIVVILLGAFLAIETLNSIRENSYIGKGVYPTNVIAINGTGEVYAIPDTASFSFSVVEEGKTVKDAQDKATKKINAILDAVKKFDIEDKDIKTTGYSSYPKYDYTSSACVNGYCPPGKQVLTGYEVSQSITVKVRDTAKAGDVLTKVGGLGASNISGLDFVVDDMDSVKDQAREKAVVVGKGPMPRTEVVKKLWAYIKKNNLQNPKNKRNILADANLLKVFGGKKEVSMFDMTKLVSKHLS